MTASTLAVFGTVAAVAAAGLLLWSSLHAGRDAKQDRDAIRSEMASGFGDAKQDRDAMRTEMVSGFGAIMERLPAPADAERDDNDAADGAEGGLVELPPLELPPRRLGHGR